MVRVWSTEKRRELRRFGSDDGDLSTMTEMVYLVSQGQFVFREGEGRGFRSSSECRRR